MRKFDVTQFNENQILIGLGGTGGQILKQFRKRLYTEYPKEEIEKMPLGFIYMDSDESALLQEDWNDIGVDYRIPPKGRVSTRSASFADIARNISNFKGISPWFGDPKDWNSLNLSGDKGAAQRRRIGRVYFANHLSNNNNFLKTLDNVRLECSAKQHSAKKTFHIFSGIAGGTGSGSLIDVIAQISKAYITPGNFSTILIYLILPETDNPVGDPPKNNAGYYYANAYACLAELNAISLNLKDNDLAASTLFYKPYDVSGNFLVENSRIKSVGFSNCYLFQDQNEMNKTFDIKEQVPKIVSDFVFQNIFYFNGNAASLAIQKITENDSASLEVDKYSTLEERSAKFSAAGISRLALPEDQITDFFANEIALQTLNQLKFNNWKKDVGYYNSKKSDDIKIFLASDLAGNKKIEWKLTLDFLRLDKPVQDSDIKLNIKPIAEEWHAMSPSFLKFSLTRFNNGQTKMPLSDLWKYYVDYSYEHFRGCGVSKWWNQKDVDKTAAAIFDVIIHPQIFEMWLGSSNKPATLSLSEIRELLTDMSNLLDELGASADVEINRITNEKFDSRTAKYSLKGCLDAYTNLTKEFTGIGIIGGFFDKHEKILEQANTFALMYHQYSADLESFNFAKNLIVILKKRINSLDEAIDSLLKKVDLALKESEKTTEILKTLIFDKSGVVNSGNSYIQYIYDIPNVKKIYDQFFKTEDQILQNEAYKIRSEMAIRIGTKNNFVSLNEAIKSEDFKNEFLYFTKVRLPEIQNELFQNDNILIIP